MKVGDRVRLTHYNETGTVLDIWDGKYTVPYYKGEQYNPYRITVAVDPTPKRNPEMLILTLKAEHLEIM